MSDSPAARAEVFAQVPVALAAAVHERCGRRSGAALIVLVGLLSYADPEGHAYPSRRTLGRRLRLSQATVHRGLEALEDAGLISRCGMRGRKVVEWKVASLTPPTESVERSGLTPPTESVGGRPTPPTESVESRGLTPPTESVEGPTDSVDGGSTDSVDGVENTPRELTRCPERPSGLVLGGPASDPARPGDPAGCEAAGPARPAADRDRAAITWVIRTLVADPRWLPKLEARDAGDRVQATTALVARYAATWPARSLETWWHLAHHPSAKRLARDPVAYVCTVLRRAIDAETVPTTRQGRPDPLWAACVAGDYEGALQELRRRTLPAGTREAGTDADPADRPGAAPSTDVGPARRVVPGSADQLVPQRRLLPPAAACNGHDLASDERELSAAGAGGLR